MNNVIRSTFKLTTNSGVLNVLRQGTKPEYARKRMYTTFSNICMKSTENNSPKSVLLWNKLDGKVSKYSQNKVSGELAEFLDQEISAEQQLQKTKTIPSKIDDFEVKLDGSDVTLIKSTVNETIEISFNVNHSVSVPEDNLEAISEESQFPEMKSKPQFDVDIKRGDTTLGFGCSFVNSGGENQVDEEMPEDIFAIDEITLYKGEWKEKDYSVSAEILDGYLYDLLMNLLDEKGITNEFVEKMSELATAYEHSSYISLLRDLKKFTSS